MKRRTFLTTTASLSATAVLSEISPVAYFIRKAAQPVQLKLGAYNHLLAIPELRAELVNFAHKVQSHSNGEVSIDVENPILVKAGDFHRAMLERQFDVGIFSPTLRPELRAAGFFGSLPFGPSAEKKMNWLTEGDGASLWAKLYANVDMHPLFFGCGGNSHGRIASHQLVEHSSHSGWEKFKTNCRDARGALFKKVGFQTVRWFDPIQTCQINPIAELDLSDPLQHSFQLSTGLYDMGRTYLVDSSTMTSFTLELDLHLQRWETLSPSARTALRRAAHETGRAIHQRIVARENCSLKEIQLKIPNLVRSYPPALLTRLNDAAAEFSQKIAGENAISADIFDQLRRQA